MDESSEIINFTGELKNIDPNRLIVDGKNDEMANFFLVLGTFYNDLKSLTFYMVQANGRFKNLGEEISIERGEHGGINAHIERLTAATIHEFFSFLKKEQNILKTTEFSIIYEGLKRDLKSRWSVLVMISKGDKVDETAPFAKSLLLIRNNIAFHLSSKTIKNGFIDHFYRDEKYLGNKTAYYSVGDNMNNTRFYYCDAAVKRAIRSVLEVNGKARYEEYASELKNIIEHINFTLMALLKEYLRQRPY